MMVIGHERNFQPEWSPWRCPPYGGSYGWASAGRFHHAQSQLHRFLQKFGGVPTAQVTTLANRSIRDAVTVLCFIASSKLVGEAVRSPQTGSPRRAARQGC
jgi:hypothetical protein